MSEPHDYTVKESALDRIYDRIRKETLGDERAGVSAAVDIQRNIMPFWTSEDTRNALVATLIPGGSALLGAGLYMADKDAVKWWEGLRKPKWVDSKCVKVSSVVDIATVAPLGYASYLVFKHGGGFDYTDTRLALALYGLNIAATLATIPLVKKHNLGCLARNMWIVHGTAVATAIAFFKIHKPAGYWTLPYALWTGFYLYMVHAIKKENDPIKDL